MENRNFIERLADSLGQNATVKNVYGEPVELKDKIIIPVARVSYGFGGGFGSGKNKKKIEEQNENSDDANNKNKGGGGGGLSAKATGVYEVTAQKTRFIPANLNRQLVLAACCGFLLRGLLFKREKIKA